MAQNNRSNGNRSNGSKSTKNEPAKTENRFNRFDFNDTLAVEIYESKIDGVIANVNLIFKVAGEHTLKGFALREGTNGAWLASPARAKNGGGYFNFHYCADGDVMRELAAFAFDHYQNEVSGNGR